jgi:hypothetical protein
MISCDRSLWTVFGLPRPIDPTDGKKRINISMGKLATPYNSRTAIGEPL